MSEYKKRGYTMSDADVDEIRLVKEAVGTGSDSATIRYCVKQVLNSLKQREAV